MFHLVGKFGLHILAAEAFFFSVSKEAPAVALAGGRHCAQRGGAACFFLAGIILIGIAFLIGVPFLGGACICVSVVGAIARSGEVLRAFLKNALLAIPYKQIKKLPYRYVAMSSHVP